MSFRILTLGRLAVHAGDTELTSLPAQPLRCGVLVYLAVERESTRDALMAMFWPERPPERARHSLSQTLYELRNELGEQWLEVQGDRLRTSGAVGADAIEFERAVALGEHERALQLYAGPFLEGVHLAETHEFEAWCDRQRSRLARLHRQARSAFISERVAHGDRAAALTAARRWVELDPLDDEAQHRFIELLAESGQRSEAIRQYETYAELLRRELEVEPLDETKALVARIREGGLEATLAKVGSPAPQAPAVEDQAPDTGGMEVTAASQAGPRVPARSPFRHRWLWWTAVGYAAAAFLGLQIAHLIVTAAGLPEASLRPFAALALFGFPIVVALVWALEPSLRGAAVDARAGPVPHLQKRPRLQTWRIGVVGVVALLSVAGGAAIWTRWPMTQRAGAGNERDPGPPPNHIAILYFDDVGEDKGLREFGDALTRALIDQFIPLSQLVIRSDNAVRQFRESDAPPDSIARRLNVAMLVDGSVARLADSVRVRVQLTEGRTGTALWAQTFAQPLKGEWDWTLIRAIGQDLAAALREQLGWEIRVREWRAGTVSHEAWQLAQRAYGFRRSGQQLLKTPNEAPLAADALRAADSLLSEAAKRDPDWVEPHLLRADLAEFWAILLSVPPQRSVEERRAALQTGLEHVERALKIDPGNPRALELRGVLTDAHLVFARPPDSLAEAELRERAERDFQEAVNRDPSLARAWARLSLIRFSRGQYDAAKFAAERAYEADAFHDRAEEILSILAKASFEMGDESEALRWCREGQRRFGRPPLLETELEILAWGESLRPDPARAWELVAQIERHPEPAIWGDRKQRLEMTVASVLARAGLRDSAIAVIERARLRNPSDPRRLPLEAAALARLGDGEGAVELLRRYLEREPVMGRQLLTRRQFEPLKRDPEYRALVSPN
ncbi:MAG: hypothetical protein HY704_16800 [Gemmatimonadetes bacterium]|nr:hypothetical protein [Gemmatimonadota bacterium]